jgi:hypothetical protein
MVEQPSYMFDEKKMACEPCRNVKKNSNLKSNGESYLSVTIILNSPYDQPNLQGAKLVGILGGPWTPWTP